MKSTTLLKVLTICCIITLLLNHITAFGGGGGSGGGDGEYQPNPFLSPEERERAFKKQQKLEANKLVEDPKPTPRRNGPPSDYQFDQELPLTIGDVVPLNNDSLRPILNDLVHTAYFRYYKVNLHSQCPYWAMNRMCTSGGGCNVCECTENEIPKPWRIESTDHIADTAEKDVFPEFDLGCGNNGDSLSKQKLLSNWDVNVWSDAEKEQGDQHATYVNLLDNIEGNTGYNGEEPRRIWDAIYNENCFARIGHNNVDDMCFQDRLMYRLISGLHSSISAHVFKNWKLNDDWSYIHNQFLWNMLFTTQQHNMSPQEFQALAQSKDPKEMEKFKKMIVNDNKVLERINNLFFTLELLLESLSTLHQTTIVPFTADLTEDQTQNSIVINTGDYDQDLHTATLLTKLIDHAYNRSAHYTPSTRSAISQSLVPPPTMHSTFATLDQNHIDNMRHLFHNVSIIMNCVGCEKCRIWSKLNILGISTGLKLAASQSTKNTQAIITSLKRNEIIAFVNTLNSFSEAVHFINTLSEITTGLHSDDNMTDPIDASVVDKATKQATTGDKATPSTTTTTETAENNAKTDDTKSTKAKPTTKEQIAKRRKEMTWDRKLLLLVMMFTTIGIIAWRYSANTASLSISHVESGVDRSENKNRQQAIQQRKALNTDQQQQQQQPQQQKSTTSAAATIVPTSGNKKSRKE